jgi:hypothetical protein
MDASRSILGTSSPPLVTIQSKFRETKRTASDDVAETLLEPTLSFSAEKGYDPAKTKYAFIMIVRLAHIPSVAGHT